MILSPLLKTVTISAPAEVVFDALVEPQRIVAYFPVDRVEIDPRVGGSMRIDGIADGEPFTDHGIIERFDRPTAFRYRYWSTNHGTERTRENYMAIDYRIEAVGRGSVVLHLRHENLLTTERKSQMDGVWDFLLAGLKAYAESPRETEGPNS